MTRHNRANDFFRIREAGNAGHRNFWPSMAALTLLAIATPAFADGDPVHGKIVFNRCAACHSVTGQKRMGPPLNGVIGRTAGLIEGTQYSDALRNAGIVWSDDNLDRFLQAPQKFLTGTTMMISLPQARDRADVIAYLKTLDPARRATSKITIEGCGNGSSDDQFHTA